MFIQLQITEKCTLNCTYCFEGEKEVKSMTIAEGKQALDFIFGILQKLVRQIQKRIS